jgi:hypothetical protein
MHHNRQRCRVVNRDMTSNKHAIQEDKADEVKALIARYILLRVEQKKIESKLSEIARFYDTDALRTIFEPIGESMMGSIGLELLWKKDNNTTSQGEKMLSKSSLYSNKREITVWNGGKNERILHYKEIPKWTISVPTDLFFS